MLDFKPKMRNSDDGREIFDPLRRRYVSFTPEEFVRQYIIHYLINDKGVPSGLISVEKSIRVDGLAKRVDIAIYNSRFEPALIIECKHPQVELSQKVFDQVFRYNRTLNAKYVAVTNGKSIICCIPDYTLGKHHFTNDFPDYSDINA